MPAFAERFFEGLGATQVDSVDASNYEAATIIHDMNNPVPAAWHERYDLVFDGGTLEHVFNLPVALGNCMRMLRQGGRFIATTPMNGWAGHGFYQFSPELFYGVFSGANGFSIVNIYANDGNGAFYAVANPADVRERVELCTRLPASLYVHARRDVVTDVLSAPPQQTDYVAYWSEGAARPKESTDSTPSAPLPRSSWKNWPIIEQVLFQRRRFLYLRRNSFRNRKHYRRVHLE
jgi:SAM-dependent methyltransferase